jgi:bacterioferritin-associated ferredoxin
VDTVCLGYGLLPSTQLSQQIGCTQEFHPGLRVYVPQRDRWLESSVGGFFVIGDAGDIRGVNAAKLEGRIAAIRVAEQLGLIEAEQAKQKAEPLLRQLQRECQFAQLLQDLFAVPAGLMALADDDTIICRCEGIRLGSIRQAVRDGAEYVQDIKYQLRTGMGWCQGRMCATTMAGFIARERGCSVEHASYQTVRPPAFPVALEDLMHIKVEMEDC